VATAAGALVLSGDPAPTDSAAADAGRLSLTIRPLRVRSGDEIATGFAVGGNRIVTVAHVLDGGAVVNGRRARVLRVDRRDDLALLAVSGATALATSAGGERLAGSRGEQLAGSRALAESRGVATESAAGGAPVRVLRLRSGRTSSLAVHVRRAIVAHVHAPGAARTVTRPALELAAHVAAGDSGAPVVSGSGALAGVVFATSRTRERTAYAVDASALARLLARD